MRAIHPVTHIGRQGGPRNAPKLVAVRRLVLLVVLGIPGTLHAQTTRPILQDGNAVRVQRLTPGGSWDHGVRGTVTSIVGDSLILVQPLEGGDAFSIPATDRRIRIMTYGGRRRSTVRGAFVGFFLGALSGTISGSDGGEPCPSRPVPDAPACVKGGPEALKGGLIGAAIGTPIGAALGSLIKRDIWITPLGFPDVQAARTGPPHGAGIAVSVVF